MTAFSAPLSLTHLCLGRLTPDRACCSAAAAETADTPTTPRASGIAPTAPSSPVKASSEFARSAAARGAAFGISSGPGEAGGRTLPARGPSLKKMLSG